MADRYPKSTDEIIAENAALRADVARLQSSVGQLQAAVVARDAEIQRLSKPKAPPRVLDVSATDKFVSAAGTGQSDATLLTYAHNTISTVAALAGVRLPVIVFSGEEMTVFNDGVNNLLIYPSTGAQINALGANNPYTLPAAQAITFRTTSSTLWRTPAAACAAAGLGRQRDRQVPKADGAED